MMKFGRSGPLAPHRTIVMVERSAFGCEKTISLTGDENDLSHRGSGFRRIIVCGGCSRTVDHAVERKAGDEVARLRRALPRGQAGEKTSNSMAMEKSAILPDAGGSNSFAPTVQTLARPWKS